MVFDALSIGRAILRRERATETDRQTERKRETDIQTEIDRQTEQRQKQTRL